jgi:hypothetical protein
LRLGLLNNVGAAAPLIRVYLSFPRKSAVFYLLATSFMMERADLVWSDSFVSIITAKHP